jgi:hypothetical protein
MGATELRIDMQTVEQVQNPVPFTPERAATELARARRQLTAALGSLDLALAILRALPEVGERWQLVAAEGVLARLDEARSALDHVTIG